MRLIYLMSLISLKKSLGQVFTPSSIGELLASEIIQIENEFVNVLDMGAGIGVLTKSLLAKNIGKNYDLIEIDQDLSDILMNDNELKHSQIYNLDICDFSFKKYDLIISNPPFLKLKFEEIKEYGDIYFLELMWENLQWEGTFSFIVTNKVISNSKYKKMREKILKEVSYISVIELDIFVYYKTEVQSFIITGRKSKEINELVVLKKANIYGDIVDLIEINKECAVVRMDISYYKALESLQMKVNNDLPLLGDLTSSITRGSESNNYFRSKGIMAFHTTDFIKNNEKISFNQNIKDRKYKILDKGNIIIPRVGSRCLEYSAIVENGEKYFTDCIYRLEVDKNYQKIIFDSISSPTGKLWRQIASTGSCAKHLTIQSLQNMPLFF